MNTVTVEILLLCGINSYSYSCSYSDIKVIDIINILQREIAG